MVTKDLGLCLLIVAACLAFWVTSPSFPQSAVYQLFMAMPPYVQITLPLFGCGTLCALALLIIRFFSQDWAGTKMRYEERRMKGRDRLHE